MKYHLLSLVLLLVLANLAFAQPDPNNAPPLDNRLMVPMLMLRSLDQMPAITKNSPQGFFALRHGILVKYDAQTLKEQSTLELLGPLGEWNKERLSNWDDAIIMLLGRVRHMMPGNLLVDGKDLIILLGGQYLRVDSEKMQIKCAVQLLDPDPLLDIARSMQQAEGMAMNAAKLFIPMQAEVDGKVVHITHGSELYIVNAEDGKLLARNSLSAKLNEDLIPMPNIPIPGMGGGKPEAATPEDDKPFTIIGVITKHPEAGDGVWTIKEGNGAEYVLLNGQGARQGSVPRIEGVRVLVRGTYRAEAKDMPKFGKGYLEVVGFLLLTTIEAAK